MSKVCRNHHVGGGFSVLRPGRKPWSAAGPPSARGARRGGVQDAFVKCCWCRVKYEGVILRFSVRALVAESILKARALLPNIAISPIIRCAI